MTTSSEFLAFVEEYQTLLVGVVGFLGVIWTLRANARLAREDQKRTTASKRAALRRILAAEFRNHCRAMKKNLASDRPTDEYISVGRVNRLYSDYLANDLGLLHLGEIDVVVNALISLDGMSHFMETISSQTSETRFLLPNDAWEDFRKVSSTTADALNYAIETLEMSGEA